jgi:hypothetical protein
MDEALDLRNLLEYVAGQEVQDYLQRGTRQGRRKFEGFETDQLCGYWPIACKAWLADRDNPDRLCELNDVSAELRFVDVEVPYGSVGDVNYEVLCAEMKKRRHDPELRAIITSAYDQHIME